MPRVVRRGSLPKLSAEEIETRIGQLEVALGRIEVARQLEADRDDPSGDVMGDLMKAHVKVLTELGALRRARSRA